MPKPSSFLQTTWPKLVAKGKAHRRKSISAPILARFALYGLEPPEGLAELLTPLDAHEAPPLLDLVPGTHAPAIRASAKNAADALLVAAAGYRPLWSEVFAGVFEFGSTGSGDLWVVAYDALGKKDDHVFRYTHEGDDLAEPVADGVASFLTAQIACAEGADKELTKLKASLAGRVNPEELDGAIDVEPFTPTASTVHFIFYRAAWLITLLAEEDPSDQEIRGNFSLKANVLMDDALLEKRRANLLVFAPTAFYCVLATYLGSDVAFARKVAAHVATSKVALIRDLGTAVVELLDGKRKKLGPLADAPALRERILALDLWGAPKKEKKQPGDAALDALVSARGIRDEAKVAAFTKKKDRALVPRMVERIASGSKSRPLFMEILRDWRETTAIVPLAGVLREVDRFHVVRKPYLDLVHAAGGPEHTPLLVEMLGKLGPKVKGDDRYLDGVIVRALLALGKHGGAKAAETVLRFVNSPATDAGNDVGIGVLDAALHAAAELGATELLPALVKRMGTAEIYRSPGLRWALGRLGATADAKTKAAIRKRLDEVRAEDPEAVFFMADEATSELALEHARVLLGAPDAPLKKLVAQAMKKSDDREVHAWLMLVLRARPELDRAAAKKLAKGEGILRSLAEDALAAR